MYAWKINLTVIWLALFFSAMGSALSIDQEDSPKNINFIPNKPVFTNPDDARTPITRGYAQLPIGEAAAPEITWPINTYFQSGNNQHSPSPFSRGGFAGGSRALFGIDKHVALTNQSHKETNQSLAADKEGNLWLVFEEDNNPFTILSIYWSNDGGENWLYLGYLYSPMAHLKSPSIAIGARNTEMLLLAYIFDDGVNMPYPQVATSPLRSNKFSFHSVPVWQWDGFAKPVIWTDSSHYSNWYAYLACEGIFDSNNNNINVCAWRSKDFGETWEDKSVVLGNSDSFAWVDPEGGFGTTKKRLYIASFNKDDQTLYCVPSDNNTGVWQAPVAVYTMNDLPTHPVDPEVEASINHDNVLICCTKSYNNNDNVGTSWSTDAGDSWGYLYSITGYTSDQEFAPVLTASPGGGSWHLAYTCLSGVYYSYAPQDYSGVFQATHDRVDDAGFVSHVFPKKGIASTWESDCAMIAWTDYRDGTNDYDTYFDRADDSTRIYVPEQHVKLQDAMSNANNGDRIHVNKGTYHGNFPFKGKAITLQSVFGPEYTIINGLQKDYVFSFIMGEGKDSVIDGFTITNGINRGVICNASSPTIRNNIIRNNSTVSTGGGISCTKDANPDIINNWIMENHANEGGGLIFIDSSPLVQNNIIAANISDARGGGVFCNNSEALFINNNFVSNKALSSGGGLYVMGSKTPDVWNCIFWKNLAPNNAQISASLSNPPDVSYSDVQDGWNGVGCIDADPMFKDLPQRDYRLTRVSPCINMGVDAKAPYTDIDYNARPIQGTSDIGCYEYDEIHSLSAYSFKIHESQQTKINFILDASISNAYKPYMILASLTGTAPGLPLPGSDKFIPINFDIFTHVVINLTNSSIFNGFMGTLDKSGAASAMLNTLGPLPPGLVGLTWSFAYACEKTATQDWFTSNPINLTVVP